MPIHKRDSGLGLKILRGIGLGLGLTAVSILSPQFPYIILRAYLKKKFGETYQPSQLVNSVNYLKRQKFIAYNNGRYVATRIGRKKVVEANQKEITIKTVPWDSKWRFVSFDVPEEQKIARQMLLSRLKSLGFRHVQRSLLVIPYPCEKEIALLCATLNITPFVFIFIADRFPADNKLAKFFKI